MEAFLDLLFQARFVLLAALAIAIAVSHVRAYRYAEAAKYWPQVTGVVLQAEVVASRDRNGNDVFSPNVSYLYRAGGRDRAGSVVTFDEAQSRRLGDATDLMHELVPGGEVIVYVDPTDPDNAVLVPGGNGQRLALNLVLLVVAMLAFAVWLMGMERP